MHYREVSSGREFVARLETGADWRAEIEALADEQGIDAAWFAALGSLRDAELRFYDQAEKEYVSATFDEPLNVASCVGNVGWLDGERFAHTHVVCSRPSGQAVAGRLEGGTVFAGECYLRELEVDLTREPDPTTGLDLWL